MGGSGTHGGPAHNKAIDDFLASLPPEATDRRKGQAQVDSNGNKVGNNLPDVQYNLNGQHWCVEFNTRDSKGHGATIAGNDPNAQVVEFPVGD